MDIPAKNMVAVLSESGLFSGHLDCVVFLHGYCCRPLEIFLSMKLQNSYGMGLEKVFSAYIHKDKHELSILNELSL